MTIACASLREGCIVSGPLFSEPMRVVTIQSDPARFPWQEVVKIRHYWLDVNSMTRPMIARDGKVADGDELK